MKRWTKILLRLFATFLLWCLIISGKLWPLTPDQRFHATLIPFYVLLVLGIYAGVSVLYKVFTFRECSGAYVQLKREIKRAKEDLDEKGFYNTSM